VTRTIICFKIMDDFTASSGGNAKPQMIPSGVPSVFPFLSSFLAQLRRGFSIPAWRVALVIGRER
jgi:hypothetical protein